MNLNRSSTRITFGRRKEKQNNNDHQLLYAGSFRPRIVDHNDQFDELLRGGKYQEMSGWKLRGSEWMALK